MDSLEPTLRMCLNNPTETAFVNVTDNPHVARNINDILSFILGAAPTACDKASYSVFFENSIFFSISF